MSMMNLNVPVENSYNDVFQILQNLFITCVMFQVWNLRTGKCSKTILAHEGPVWALCRHEDTLITVSQDKTVSHKGNTPMF